MDCVQVHHRLLPDQYNAMLFTDWLEAAEAIIRERERTAKTGMIQSAYTAWLLGAGGNKYQSWGSFLENYGLIEKTPRKEVDTKKLYEMADGYLAKME
ncbi:MAG: hypothetical protein LBU70_04835 [Chitinispirillales bacterium]|jgi:hypothetical protein|nr:hypothetical protein [Chitinispirillales bacterium]